MRSRFNQTSLESPLALVIENVVHLGIYKNPNYAALAVVLNAKRHTICVMCGGHGHLIKDCPLVKDVTTLFMGTITGTTFTHIVTRVADDQAGIVEAYAAVVDPHPILQKIH